MIVTITGANGFARKQELSKLVASFVQSHGDMAVERFDGEETPAERLRESVESLPFLSARKLVVLREPGKQKAFVENITDILAAAAETTDLIIVESKLDKRSAYYKTLHKQTNFLEFGELDSAGLARWAAEYVTDHKGTLSMADARLLIDRIGPNQQLLQSELDKLLSFNSKITRQTIEALVEPTPQSTVFELLDAAFSGNAKRTLQLYKEQRAMKVEALAIVAMLVWQLHIVTVVKAAGNRSADDIGRLSKLSPFVVRKSQHIARKLSGGQIKTLVAGLLALDIRLKTTGVDADEALQYFLLQTAKI
ncbi:MAG TPA: DNA polymerase III subunit delta [Candidatus Saccharimonadales bacterium]|nr:DNA polymerase III subunit delta [Candidatus Saccharimonadales bacterium]